MRITPHLDFDPLRNAPTALAKAGASESFADLMSGQVLPPGGDSTGLPFVATAQRQTEGGGPAPSLPGLSGDTAKDPDAGVTLTPTAQVLALGAGASPMVPPVGFAHREPAGLAVPNDIRLAPAALPQGMGQDFARPADRSTAGRRRRGPSAHGRRPQPGDPTRSRPPSRSGRGRRRACRSVRREPWQRRQNDPSGAAVARRAGAGPRGDTGDRDDRFAQRRAHRGAPACVWARRTRHVRSARRDGHIGGTRCWRGLGRRRGAGARTSRTGDASRGHRRRSDTRCAGPARRERGERGLLPPADRRR